MKNIVVAAGYATRLGELTKNFPKPLLKIGENTILGRMLDDIDTIPQIDEHVIITNHKFAPVFEEWAKEQHYSKPVTIVDDGTSTNETRLGAVCDLLFAMDKLRIDDDILLVAADNLLFFTFKDFVDFALQKQTSCMMCHNQPSVVGRQQQGTQHGGEAPSAKVAVGGTPILYLPAQRPRPRPPFRRERLRQRCPGQPCTLHGGQYRHPRVGNEWRTVRHRQSRHLLRSVREIQ